MCTREGKNVFVNVSPNNGKRKGKMAGAAASREESLGIKMYNCSFKKYIQLKRLYVFRDTKIT